MRKPQGRRERPSRWRPSASCCSWRPVRCSFPPRRRRSGAIRPFWSRWGSS
ncbi:MAG: hypothetical protein AB7S41_06385 [Parvibaculaceae bacterium]